jgi:hypothetical protein
MVSCSAFLGQGHNIKPAFSKALCQHCLYKAALVLVIPMQTSTGCHANGECVEGFVTKSGIAVGQIHVCLLSLVCACVQFADKSQQMSDWQSRPLTDRQKTYAALDAYVLPKCFDVLKQQLGPEATQQLVQQHTKTLSRVSDTSKHSLASAKLSRHLAAFVASKHS